MFAPGTGRWLFPTFAALGVAWALWATAVLPRTIALAALLALTSGIGAFVAWFFRDPERAPGPGIVAPADGRVLAVEREGERWRVSVFMNVTDVHVNRFPLTARVDAIGDGGAGFRPAYRADAAHNVARRYDLSTSIGPVEVVQMTGIAARRLVSFVRPGDARAKGDRLGMIVLGSRVDVVLPGDATPLVVPGTRVVAGVTTIAQGPT